LNSNNIACPLDCFDTCEASYNKGAVKPSLTHRVTNKKLCINFAKLLKEETFSSAFYENKNINLKQALEILRKKLEETKPSKTLYYKGSGNIGVFQSYPKTFFAKYGSTFTRGGLCDSIGSHALETSRGGANVNPSLEKLLSADVIICWGRNFSVTSSHMYNLVKDKTFITIDPISTPIAKKSQLYLQIKPKTDYELALLLTHYAKEYNLEDEAFIKEHKGKNFINLAQERSLESYEKTLGLPLSEIKKLMELIKGKSVALMLGLGAQKYYEGSSIFRVIDAFAACIGLHNPSRTAGGVWYLSDASYGYDKQLKTSKKKEVDITSVDYGAYDLLFIQGGDLLVSNPNSLKILNALKKTFVVYFGTCKNETSAYANLIIPAATFLQKKDVRLSYGHEEKVCSYKHEHDEEKISEYELSKYLFKAFDFEGLKDENEVFEYYKNAKAKAFILEKYNFIETLTIKNLYDEKKENEYYFITAKAKKSLNSQFSNENNVYLHPSSSFSAGQEVTLRSEFGEAKFIVCLSQDVREDCILCYAGNKHANYLTPARSDAFASSAIFQELLVHIDVS